MGLWGVVKKSINSNLNVPLNKTLDQINAAIGIRTTVGYGTTAQFNSWRRMDFIRGAISGAPTYSISEAGLNFTRPSSDSHTDSWYVVDGVLGLFDFDVINSITLLWSGSITGTYPAVKFGTIPAGQAVNYANISALVTKSGNGTTWADEQQTFDVTALSGQQYVVFGAMSGYDNNTWDVTMKKVTMGGKDYAVKFDTSSDQLKLYAAHQAGGGIATSPKLTSPLKLWDFINFFIADNGGAHNIKIVDAVTGQVLKENIQPGMSLTDITAQEVYVMMDVSGATVLDWLYVSYLNV